MAKMNLVASPAAPVADKQAKAKTLTATPDRVTKPLPFAKGKGADARNVAYGDVATFAYLEGKSRAETVATLRLALGKAPTLAQVEACRVAYCTGRVAASLTVDQFQPMSPREVEALADRIHYAGIIFTAMAAPAKDGVAPRKLRKGQVGRRTIAQHKAVRAADSAWSLLKAEIAPEQSAAMTQAAKNKAQRAPAAAGSTARGKGGKGAGTGVTHSELVAGDKPMTAERFNAWCTGMAATMLMTANKHAGVASQMRAEAIRRFHADIALADKASREG